MSPVLRSRGGVVLSTLLALLSILAFASSAQATVSTATDAYDDYHDGFEVSTDFRKVTWDSTSQAGKVLLTVELDNAQDMYLGGAVFIDTNKDGKDDYAVQILSGESQHPSAGTGHSISYVLRPIAASSERCQIYRNSPTDNPTPATVTPTYRAASGSDRATTVFTIPIALTDLGSPTGFSWSAMGYQSASDRHYYDIVPDTANYNYNPPFFYDPAVDGPIEQFPLANPHEDLGEFGPKWECSTDGGYNAGYPLTTNPAKAATFDIGTVAPPVVEPPRISSIGQVPESVPAGRPLKLTASYVQGTKAIARFDWDLNGDGQFGDASGESVTKTFVDEGTHRVSVRVYDVDGRFGEGYRDVRVLPAPPGLSISPDILAPIKSQKVTFTANFGGDGVNLDDVEWGIDFVDNTVDLPYNQAKGRSWKLGFGTPTVWVIKARVKDDQGKVWYARYVMTVVNQAPVVRQIIVRVKKTPDVIFNKDPLVRNQPILLTASFTDDYDQMRPTVDWDLDGDGDFDDGTGETIETKYPEGGTKTAAARITDQGGLVVIGKTEFDVRESADAPCAGKAGDDDVHAVGCFKSDPVYPGTKVTTEPFKLNGLDVVPQGGSQVHVSVGGLLFSTGGGGVQIKAGTIVLFDGQFRMDPTCNSAVQECLMGKWTSPALSSVKGLPLKGDVEVWKTPTGTRVHVNVDIFGTIGLGVTAKADLIVDEKTGLKLDSLEVRSPNLPLGKLSIGQFFLKYSSTTRLWEGGGSITLPTPMFTKLTGDFAWHELYGPQRMHGEVDGLDIPLDPFGTVYLQRIAFTIEIKGFGGSNPRIRLGGGLGISAGPRIAGVDIATFDGDFLFTFGNPTGIDLDGRLSVAGFDVVGVQGSAYTNGDMAVSGFAQFGLPFPRAYKGKRKDATKVKVSRFDRSDAEVFNPLTQAVSIKGEISAWVEPQAFDLEGSVSLKVLGINVASARALASSIAIAGCGEVVGISGGFGYTYATDKVDVWGGSCDLGPYRPVRQFQPADDNGAGITARRAKLRGAPASTSVDVAEGQPALMLRLAGTAGDPIVTLIDPDGRKYEMPASGETVQTDEFFATRNTVEGNDETYIGVHAPKAGRWTIVPQAGSVPVAAVEGAAILPDPDVKATVTGTGATRTVTYDIKQIPGQVVTFSEIGKDSHNDVGTAEGAHGTLTFTPQEGTDRSRKLYAIVNQGGMIRDRILVASFVAPKPAPPAPPATAVAKRLGKHHGTVEVRWPAVAGITHYLVVARTSDGRVRAFPTKSTRQRVKIGASSGRFEVRSMETVAKMSRKVVARVGAAPSLDMQPPKSLLDHEIHNLVKRLYGRR